LRAKTVAHHDPVNRAQSGLRPQLSRAPDHFGIDRGAKDLLAVAVDPGQQVKVDETVIERCDQRIGEAMGHLAQSGVRTGTVDHDEIAVRLQFRHRRREAPIIDILARLELIRGHFGQFVIPWAGQVEARRRHELGAVFGVAPKGTLAQIEIKRAGLVAHPGQSRRHMHRHGRFARAALFIADDDDMRHSPFPLGREVRIVAAPGLFAGHYPAALQ